MIETETVESERSWLKEKSVCRGGSVTLYLSSKFTSQRANGQTIHPYLPCSMPIPLDGRELDSHIQGRILFNLKDPIKSLFLSTSASLSSALPPSLSGSFPVEVELSLWHSAHTHTQKLLLKYYQFMKNCKENSKIEPNSHLTCTMIPKTFCSSLRSGSGIWTICSSMNSVLQTVRPCRPIAGPGGGHAVILRNCLNC